MTETELWDGRDDTVIPEELVALLHLLPDFAAEQIREELTGRPLRFLADDTLLVRHKLGMAVKRASDDPEVKAELAAKDLTSKATVMVAQIAQMYGVLHQAGLSEAVAIDVIYRELDRAARAGTEVITISGSPMGIRPTITRPAPQGLDLPGVFNLPVSYGEGWPPANGGSGWPSR